MHDAWGKYSSCLDWVQLKQQTPEVYKILLSLRVWHEKNDTDLKPIELPVWFELQYPGLSDKQKEVYQNIIEQSGKEEIRPELTESYLTQLKSTQTRRTLAVMAMDDSVSVEKVQEQAGLLEGKPTLNNIGFITTDLDELLQIDEDVPGFKWRLNCLNRSLGSLRKGMFGVILARVETGKTAMWVSEISYIVQQLKDDEHVCVFFNEENGRDVMWRIYSAICRATTEQIQTNPERAKELFNSRGGHRIKFIDQANQTTKGIERILDTLNPALIIVDSLDKIKGFDEERRDTKLGMIYEWGRTTAKTYAPLIGVSQASAPEGGRQKQWLTELDMADSKTAKPAELDYLIGIGIKTDAGYENMRYINIPKNKRRGGVGLLEAERHGKFSCLLKSELSIYEDN